MWRYGPWAVVVGASDGIGAAFAEEIAARGGNVVLVARRQTPLDALAERLREAHRIQTGVVVVDAGTPDGITAVAGISEDIGLLVCNAALAPVGPFLELTPEVLDAMLDLNCRSAAHLAHAYGARFKNLGRGGIVLLSSMAGDQGSALVAHYAATKAYLRVLAEGLWAELRPHGVDVLASCPGLVRTPTFERTHAAPPGRMVPPPMPPRTVARETLNALGRGPVFIPGRRNRLLGSAARLLPRRRAVALASRETERLYPTESRHAAPEDGSGG
jgi:short-subunit dehydrogenase